MNIVEPNVTILAHTAIAPLSEWDATLDFHGMEVQPTATDTETLMEFAGRQCYKSFHRPNPETATTQSYLERTLFDQGHWSIAEHASVTLHITGVSRAFLTELTRHRHLSFSVQSQRFVDESDCNVVMPPAIRDNLLHQDDIAAWKTSLEHAIIQYQDTAEILEDDASLPRKQAREAARSVLPNAVETRMVVSGNLRAWKNVIALRTAPGVDAEMVEVMTLVRDQLATIAPTIFKEQA
ncbi:FAD-dependent thymidylate synthase [Corynebacterium neomassiliense]|uniref:FAD-dependent thymidylate synthase n=1 Tax=Corynebacterium neomassiliense TaxID=2079482 RepID=UPI00103111B0|nr:FAD-dependent thymidylate synthase [Corynebacterium neomassiliense]